MKGWIVTLDVLKWRDLNADEQFENSWIVTLDVLKYTDRLWQIVSAGWIVTLDVLK